MTETDASAPDRQAHVVAVCNLKGGSGKSTLSVNLACAMAGIYGRVALIDNDEQGSAVAWATPGQLPVRCIHMPLARPEGFGLWIKELVALRAEHDLVVVDFPAGIAPALAVTLLMSSLILIPCSPDRMEVAATRRMMRHVTQVRAERPYDPPAVVVVPNRVVDWGRGTDGVVGRLQALGEEIGPPVRLDGRYDQAFEQGLWVGAWDPGSAAHRELDALAGMVWSRLAARAPALWPPARSAYATQGQPLKADPSSRPARGGPRTAPTLAEGPAAPRQARARAEPAHTAPGPRVIYLDEVSSAKRPGVQRGLPFLRWAWRFVGAAKSA